MDNSPLTSSQYGMVYACVRHVDPHIEGERRRYVVECVMYLLSRLGIDGFDFIAHTTERNVLHVHDAWAAYTASETLFKGNTAIQLTEASRASIRLFTAMVPKCCGYTVLIDTVRMDRLMLQMAATSKDLISDIQKTLCKSHGLKEGFLSKKIDTLPSSYRKISATTKGQSAMEKLAIAERLYAVARLGYDRVEIPEIAYI